MAFKIKESTKRQAYLNQQKELKKSCRSLVTRLNNQYKATGDPEWAEMAKETATKNGWKYRKPVLKPGLKVEHSFKPK